MLINISAAAMLGSPATLHAMVAEYEEGVKEVFKTIDEVAKRHNVCHFFLQ